MKYILKEYIYLIAIVVCINILSVFLYVRLDFTANHRYSLSRISKEIIRNTKAPITVDLYLSEDLPLELNKIAREFSSVVKEYKSISKVPFTFNTIYTTNEQKITAARTAGIFPDIFEIRENGYEKIQQVYMGAVFKVGNKQSCIPLIYKTPAIEYEITRIFKQFQDEVKPKIAFITGHREASFNQIHQLINHLSLLAEVDFIRLSESRNLSNYQVLCIIGPQDAYPQQEKELLDDYLAQGGRLFIALNHAVGQINNIRSTGYINKTGIESLLESKGLKISYDFIVDSHCGTVSIKQYNGGMRKIKSPYLPIINNFSEHTITYGLSSIFMPFASSIQQIKTHTAYIFIPLATTSAISGTQQAPIILNPEYKWSKKDFNKPFSIVGALLNNEDNHSAIVAVSSADFLINREKMEYSSHHILRPDNINFAINSIEWLADNSGLIRLRNKYTTFPPLKVVDKGCVSALQYLNFLLPIVVIILWMVFEKQRQKRKRQNRSRQGYID